jgi:hypothetical protein
MEFVLVVDPPLCLHEEIKISVEFHITFTRVQVYYYVYTSSTIILLHTARIKRYFLTHLLTYLLLTSMSTAYNAQEAGVSCREELTQTHLSLHAPFHSSSLPHGLRTRNSSTGDPLTSNCKQRKKLIIALLCWCSCLYGSDAGWYSLIDSLTDGRVRIPNPSSAKSHYFISCFALNQFNGKLSRIWWVNHVDQTSKEWTNVVFYRRRPLLDTKLSLNKRVCRLYYVLQDSTTWTENLPFGRVSHFAR